MHIASYGRHVKYFLFKIICICMTSFLEISDTLDVYIYTSSFQDIFLYVYNNTGWFLKKL